MPIAPKDRIAELLKQREALYEKAKAHGPGRPQELDGIDTIERELKTLGYDFSQDGEEVIRGE